MPRKSPPSLADIAAAAGVSVMAVSYALRGRGHVSAATREKIQRHTRRLGYRPDPLLVHLMHHVRTRRVRHTQANLGVLMVNDDDYTQRLVAGAEARAEQLTYAVNRIQPERFAGHPAGLTRMLEARGITGLLLPPGRAPQSVESLLDWSRFSTVAMTYSITAPSFHRVVPHHFHNTMLAVRKLREQGCVRPGLVVRRSMDLRANHAYTGALAASAIAVGAVPVPPFIAEDLARIQGWLRRHRPDALVLSGFFVDEEPVKSQLASRALARLPRAVLSYRKAWGLPGVDQKVALIGATAVDLLVAQLHRQERGPPADPIVSMIEGAWMAGRVS